MATELQSSGGDIFQINNWLHFLIIKIIKTFFLFPKMQLDSQWQLEIHQTDFLLQT